MGSAKDGNGTHNAQEILVNSRQRSTERFGFDQTHLKSLEHISCAASQSWGITSGVLTSCVC